MFRASTAHDNGTFAFSAGFLAVDFLISSPVGITTFPDADIFLFNLVLEKMLNQEIRELTQNCVLAIAV